jgi:hypothetical protein
MGGLRPSKAEKLEGWAQALILSLLCTILAAAVVVSASAIKSAVLMWGAVMIGGASSLLVLVASMALLVLAFSK